MYFLQPCKLICVNCTCGVLADVQTNLNLDIECPCSHACTNSTVLSRIRTDSQKLPLSLGFCSGPLVLGNMHE